MTNKTHLAMFGRNMDVHRIVPGSKYTVAGCLRSATPKTRNLLWASATASCLDMKFSVKWIEELYEIAQTCGGTIPIFITLAIHDYIARLKDQSGRFLKEFDWESVSHEARMKVIRVLGKTSTWKEQEMNCLSIQQPWAHAIIFGPKKVENRTWPTRYRGHLLIHAGKSHKFLDAEDPGDWPERYGVPLPSADVLTFGAILGVVDVVDCVRVEDLGPAWTGHPFAEGPFCWLLANPRPFASPIPWKGALQIFQVPDDVVTAQLQQVSVSAN